MLKKFLLFALFIVLCFMMPCFFIDFAKVNIKIEKSNIESGEILKSQSEDKIKLLLTNSNEIIELSMDDYIKGVVLRRNAYNF